MHCSSSHDVRVFDGHCPHITGNSTLSHSKAFHAVLHMRKRVMKVNYITFPLENFVCFYSVLLTSPNPPRGLESAGGHEGVNV